VAVKLKNAAGGFLRSLAVLWYAAALLIPAHAQVPEPRSSAPGGYETPEVLGDAAAAEKYAAWARQAIEEGRWGEAEAALERAADYAAVSSDLSYLLALARSHENRPRGAVLEAVRRGLEADRWRFYTPEAARLLEAETLIAVRAFSEALRSLSPLPDSAESFRFRLLVFKGLGNVAQFRINMTQALDRYPRDTRLARIFFAFYRPPEYAYPESGRRGSFFQDDRPPAIEAADRDLMALVLRRLPLLIEEDPALAYLAAPFIRDTEEARRLVGAYRAGGGRDPGALPAALILGLTGDVQAVDELFHQDTLVPQSAGPVLDRALLESVWALLRDEQGRDRFMRNLLGFSGVITEDKNRDGFPETRIRYRNGMILHYSHDAGQDGLAELEITFTAGMPDRGDLMLLPEDDDRPFAYPVSGGEQFKAQIWWELYPAVLRTRLGEITYIPRPLDFLLAPVRFAVLPGSGEPAPPREELLGYGGLLYPEEETAFPGLFRRLLAASALAIERPGTNFSGALERVELERGVPLRAREHLNGRIVSETEFLLGRPAVQRIDLDLDDRMETIRRFRQGIPPFDIKDAGADHTWDYGKIIVSSESDWDGDGVFEYGEEYLPGGVIRSWDMNRDGVREYSETGKD
jgi:tetratricopeptide (TPR) repeat protein